jgi:hypothetical protein
MLNTKHSTPNTTPMRTILFDYDESLMDERLYALNMRLAYLLSANVVCMGKNISFYNVLNSCSQPLRMATKIKLMQSMPGLKETYITGEERLKATARLNKYRNHRILVAEKKVEAAVNIDFGEYIKSLENYLYVGMKLPHMKEVGDIAEIGMLNLKDDPECQEDEHVSFSNWLQLTEEEDQQGDIMMLPADFLEHAAVKGKYVSAWDAEATNVKSIYLEHCMSLPNMQSLTLTELGSTRKKSADVLQPFRQAINNWIDLFWNEENEQVDTTGYFKSVVHPAAIALSPVAENPFMRHCARTTPGAEQIEIMIGEVPVPIIYRYFKEKKVIPKATWEKLQKATLRDERLKGRLPVITVRCNTALHTVPGKQVIVDEEPETINM